MCMYLCTPSHDSCWLSANSSLCTKCFCDLGSKPERQPDVTMSWACRYQVPRTIPEYDTQIPSTRIPVAQPVNVDIFMIPMIHELFYFVGQEKQSDHLIDDDEQITLTSLLLWPITNHQKRLVIGVTILLE